MAKMYGDVCLLLIVICSWSSLNAPMVEAAKGPVPYTSNLSDLLSGFGLNREDKQVFLKNALDKLSTLSRITSTAPVRSISGQVNLRAPRSEYGDVANAIRMYQLHEMDRVFGAKARPRFGKRNDITLEDVPSYGYEYPNSFSNGDEDERRRR